MREDPALAKINRVLVDGERKDAFPSCAVVGLPRTTSDHTPLFLRGGLEERKRHIFQFETWWARCPDLEGVIRESWEASPGGIRGAHKVAIKVRRLKRVLCGWGRQAKANRTREKRDPTELIKAVDLEEEGGPIPITRREVRGKARADIESIF
ncbi:hypothetical protein QJS10_CPA10g01215 [Acorus calamus]|uniref:Reverse transcriptase n=1 Tax=Acorus calamus TaxID=4465 RepID=A0AAV9E1N6_ACOCL|nr:hypothetical protein QJS10_CPA10g01215 [Acorus calamus]